MMSTRVSTGMGSLLCSGNHSTNWAEDRDVSETKTKPTDKTNKLDKTKKDACVNVKGTKHTDKNQGESRNSCETIKKGHGERKTGLTWET